MRTAITRNGFALGNGVETNFVNVDWIFTALKDAGSNTANPLVFSVYKFILDDDGTPGLSNTPCAQISIVPNQLHWGTGGTIWIRGVVTEATGTYPKVTLEYDDGNTERLQIGPAVGDKICAAINPGSLIGEIALFQHVDAENPDGIAIEPASMASAMASFADPESVLEITPPARPLQF